MADKFKRYGIPVRLENTPLFKNPYFDSIKMGHPTHPAARQTNDVEVNGILTSTGARNAGYSMVDAPNEWDDVLPTVGAVGVMIQTGPCLIAGTEIAYSRELAKKIEDVKPGDIILGYNPATGKTCETVVIASYCTGRESTYKVNQFSDGSRIITYGNHGYFDPVSKHSKSIPESENFTALNIDLQEVTCVGFKRYSCYAEPQKRYNLITSNNTYFADGILCAFSAQQKEVFVRRHGLAVTEKARDVLLADCQTVDAVNAVNIDRAYLKNVCPKIGEYRSLKGDSKSADKRKTLFDEIGSLRKAAKVMTPERAFAECCDRDNKALETFKEWLIPGYTGHNKKSGKR